jgi:hypothetical protein
VDRPGEPGRDRQRAGGAAEVAESDGLLDAEHERWHLIVEVRVEVVRADDDDRVGREVRHGRRDACGVGDEPAARVRRAGGREQADERRVRHPDEPDDLAHAGTSLRSAPS